MGSRTRWQQGALRLPGYVTATFPSPVRGMDAQERSDSRSGAAGERAAVLPGACPETAILQRRWLIKELLPLKAPAVKEPFK